MKLNREELLRQKALLQEHLRWLEEKLAECPDTPSSGTPGPKPPATAEPAPHPAKTSVPAPPPAALKATPPATASPPDEADNILRQYRHASMTPRQAQFGCIGIGVLLAALGLFIFLGLPYLLK